MSVTLGNYLVFPLHISCAHLDFAQMSRQGVQRICILHLVLCCPAEMLLVQGF